MKNMKITFKYKRNTISYTMKNNIIKIYEVPTYYSEDGLYISDYSINDLEPYPASEGSRTKLIYHAIERIVMGTPHMEVLTNKIGEVTYA